MNLSKFLNREERIDFSAIAEFDHKVVALQAENMRLRKKLEAAYVVASGEAVNWKAVGNKIKDFFGNIWAQIVKFFKWIWNTLKKWGSNILKWLKKLKNWLLGFLKKKEKQKEKSSEKGEERFEAINIEKIERILDKFLQETKKLPKTSVDAMGLTNIYIKNGKPSIPSREEVDTALTEFKKQLSSIEALLDYADIFENITEIIKEKYTIPISRFDDYIHKVSDLILKSEKVVTLLDNLISESSGGEEQITEMEKIVKVFSEMKDNQEFQEIQKYSEEKFISLEIDKTLKKVHIIIPVICKSLNMLVDYLITNMELVKLYVKGETPKKDK